MTNNFDFSVTTYETKAECEARIEELEKAPYYLRHGEAGRPTLFPHDCYCDGKFKWFVYAEWNFYYDTINAPKDGPYEAE